jgi:hypothetical protein
MLRINLLPPYIYEGAKRRNVVVLWAVVLAAVVGGFIFWKMQLAAEADRIAKMTQDETPDANLADNTQREADSITAANAVTRGKWEFVTQAKEHNSKHYIEVYDHVRDFTIDRVLYSGITPANDQVQINAYAPTLADVGHYMLAMERNPNIKNVSVAMNSVPGYPVSQSGAQQQQQQDQFLGGDNPPRAGGQGTMSPGGVSGMGNAPMMMRPGAGAQGGGGGQFGGQDTGPTGARPPGGGGHDFAVTLTLNKPIPGAPTYPAGGGQQGGGTGGGPAMGGMGGGSGMGGGMSMGQGMGGGSSMGPPGMGGGKMGGGG